MQDAWLFGAVVALATVNLVALLYRYRTRGTGTGRVDRDGGGIGESAGRADDAVTCPACGAENAPEYRYCRECARDLHGPAGHSSVPA